MIEILATTEGNSSVRYKNRWLYHPDKPMEHARKKAGRVSLYPDTLYLVVSPLLWYGVKEIRDKLPQGSSIMALEIDKDLKRLAKEKCPAVFKDIPLFSEDIIDFIDYSRYRKVVPVVLSSAYSLYKKEYDIIIGKIIKEIERYWRNRLTMVRLGPRFLRNIFSNLGTVRPSFSLPSTDMPVVVAAAGPSLEHCIDFIKKNREHVFLLAVDTACSALVKHGLIPDMIAILESQAINSFDFVGVPRDIPVIFDLTANSSTVRLFKGEKYTVLSHFYDVSLIERLRTSFSLHVVPALASVGSFASYVASLMTSREVILAGLDFSFYRGLSHARGSFFHYNMLSNVSRTLPWPFLWDGRFIFLKDYDLYTSSHLYSFAEQIRELNSLSGNRLFCITPSPLLLDLPLIDGFDCNSYRESDSSDFHYRPYDSAIAADFIMQEKQRLHEFIEVLKNHRVPDDRLLSELDYVMAVIPGQRVDLSNRGNIGIAISIAVELMRIMDVSLAKLNGL